MKRYLTNKGLKYLIDKEKRIKRNKKKVNSLKQIRKSKQIQKSKFKKKYYAYLESDEWKQIRIEMLITYPKCQRCGSKKCLQVHHRTYENVFNEEPEDLEVLCKKCHKQEHNI